MTPPPDQPDTDTSGKQPYSSGLLARIVAIHFPSKRFGEGLAVEFLPGSD